jgi:hypothetical protein
LEEKKSGFFALPISSMKGKSAIKIRKVVSVAATQNLSTP